MLSNAGISDHRIKNTLVISTNHPNPFIDQSIFSVYLPSKDVLNLMVYDVTGRIVAVCQSFCSAGYHDFILRGGMTGWYIITASSSAGSHSIKAICQGSGSEVMQLTKKENQEYKNTRELAGVKDFFPFAPGDQLLFIGYTSSFSGVLESGILDTPDGNLDYTFQYATNMPCPGTPTVEYEGQTYNTVQVFSQCWLKENLNVGMMIQASQDMTDNNTIEKYCYSNQLDNCAEYGGLYQWDEMMQYTINQGIQGICPPGWHLPSDEDWMVLEGAVDSEYGIGDPVWDGSFYRGQDAGTNLKATSGWNEMGNGTDLFGFSGLPGGGRFASGAFYDIGGYGLWWTTTEFDDEFTWLRYLDYNSPQVHRDYFKKVSAFSVRCLKDL
jgi:uncharacterized protein (TIGR02145 family)